MKLIKLLHKNIFTKVSDEDYEYLSKISWSAYKKPNGIYASKCPYKNRKRVLMHRLIMDTPSGMITDHINGDTLDNRRENLRVCTSLQNAQNRKVQSNNTSGYKGVVFMKRINKWRARIGVNGKRKFLGYFNTPEQASFKYNQEAKNIFKEYLRVD